MRKSTLFLAASFALLHIAFVAPFVPWANVLPAGLGALSMSSMALSLILAARWRLVDRLMGGPDKSYVAHRWLGFFALGGALGHWALASSVGAGILPVLAESGEHVGTVAALGLVVMTAAAMVRAIPYHLWKISHMAMGPIFLLAAYHTFFVASPLAVGAAPWSLMATVSLIGLFAWVQTLKRKSKPTRLVTVSKIEHFEGGVDVTFTSEKPLPHFRAGQFATIACNHARAEAHPFTIAGGDAMNRRFLIRSAGDWTGQFVRTVTEGDRFRLGHGGGRFLPKTSHQRPEQLWAAGGAGITPFLAVLDEMMPDDGPQVHLVYCMRSRATAGGLEDVERHLTRLPQLRLHIFCDEEGNQLTPKALARIVRYISESAELYLCGPEGLKYMVTQTWKAHALTGKVHSESFDFRGAYGLTDMIYIGKPVAGLARDLATRAKERAYAAAGT